MVDESPEVVADILMHSALDKTRDEIAQAVNADRGTNLSARQCGAVINTIEEQAAKDDERAVFYQTLMRGAGAEVGLNIGAALDDLLDQV